MRVASFAVLLVLLSVATTHAQGLNQKWSWPDSGSQIVQNPSFEEGASGWTFFPASGHWSIDCAAAFQGACSLSLLNANTASQIPTANQTVSIQPGWYDLFGHINSSGETIPSSGGRVAAFDAEGNSGAGNVVVGGTSNGWIGNHDHLFWMDGGSKHTATVQAQGYGRPNGEILFDAISLEAATPPDQELFLLYPNYLGIADEGHDLSVSYRGKSGTSTLTVIDQDTKATVYSHSVTVADSWVNATIPFATQPNGHYEVLLSRGGANYNPSYNIVKQPLADIAHIDDQGFLWLADASGTLTRRFVIGYYNTTGYFSTVQSWQSELSQWFPALRGDLYLDYTLGSAPYNYLALLGQALSHLGMAYIDTVNTSYMCGSTPCSITAQSNPPWFRDVDQVTGPNTKDLIPRAQTLAGQPGIFGWYTADEESAEWANTMWGQRVVLRRYAPEMPAFAAENVGNSGQNGDSLLMWRDVVDVLGVDPYPVYNSQPLGIIPQWIAIAQSAVQNARPVWAVVQFWGNGDGTRWPTFDQLREETWLAICSGAQGVFYWSLGQKGLADLQTQSLYQEEFSNLQSVTSEVKDWEPELLGAPVAMPETLPNGIIGVARLAPAATYVFTINTTANTITDAKGHTWGPFQTLFWH